MLKLRELHVTGNPLDYPARDVVKKGSKYLIRYLQEKWRNEQNCDEAIKLNNETNTIKKVDKKILQKDKITNKQTVINK